MRRILLSEALHSKLCVLFCQTHSDKRIYSLALVAHALPTLVYYNSKEEHELNA